MILAAVYIEEHYLFQGSQMINFGAQAFFDFQTNRDNKHFVKKPNENYISDFYGPNTSLISAIVGANGVGKTTILRILNEGLDETEAVFFYLSNSQVIVKNKHKIKFVAENFKYTTLNTDEELYPLYYSPNIDYNIQNFHSPISLSNYFQDTLSEFYFNNLERQLLFLNSAKAQRLKQLYPDLPYFEKLNTRVNNFKKEKFLNIYQDSNMGKSMRQEFDMVWNSYNLTNAINDFIHDDSNFTRDLEISLLSLLVLNDTYIVTNDNGFSIGFKEVLDQLTFHEKLNKFLEKCLDNIDSPSFHILKKGKIDVFNSDLLIHRLKKIKTKQLAGGFDYDTIRKLLINCITTFKTVYDFYILLVNFTTTKIVRKDKEKEVLEISVNDLQSIKNLIKAYTGLVLQFRRLPAEFRILNFYTDKRLSTGENALLDFYSSLYYFTIEINNHLREKKSYLLLLDEPEQGYHALWKKKFINSITTVLPLLFEDLKFAPTIQIIFTTHDPLTLSDFPNHNIIYFDKENNRILPLEESSTKNSFGANISDILAESFFIGDGLIGEFAKDKIQNIIDYLNNLKTLEEISWAKNSIDIRVLIECIGEPFLKDKLTEMYLEKFPNTKDIEIRKLEEKLKELRNGSNTD